MNFIKKFFFSFSSFQVIHLNTSHVNGKFPAGDFVVFHRVAIAETHLGKGFAKVLFTFIEEFAKDNNILSVKADTNFDNGAMLSLFDKSGYVYCGEVHFRGSPRKAYEKVLEKT